MILLLTPACNSCYALFPPSLPSVRTFLVLPELTQEVGVWEETKGMCVPWEGM